MFFILSKVIAFLIQPAVWLMLLLLWILFASKPAKRKRRVLITLVLTYLLMNPFLADEAIRKLELTMQELPEGKSYAGAIVLGGNIAEYDQEYDRIIFRNNTDRLLQARLLYSEERISKIILSGGPGNPWQPEQKEAYFLYTYLVETGIPAADVLYEINSRNTHENALEVRLLMERAQLQGDFLLITSASHMRRAMACFAKTGIEVTPYPVDKITGPRMFNFRHLFIPDIRSLQKWNEVLHEVIGMIAYRIAGYI